MPAINLRLIEVFLCAARHQNISRAVQELYISQPALSKTISRLEKDYGGPLFSRRSRGGQLAEGEAHPCFGGFCRLPAARRLRRGPGRRDLTVPGGRKKRNNCKKRTEHGR